MTEKKGYGSATAQRANAKAAKEGKQVRSRLAYTADGGMAAWRHELGRARRRHREDDRVFGQVDRTHAPGIAIDEARSWRASRGNA